MREGSLEAPTRHPIDWQNPDFYDDGKLEAEMRRVFDICHGCRRCFNLCDSFPRLFDLIDNSPDRRARRRRRARTSSQVVDACTLCDMCFMTKCPYVPPHEFNLDFPHLMLRYRAVELQQGKRRRLVDRAARRDRPQRQAGRRLSRRSPTGRRDATNKLTRPADGEGRRHRPRRRAAAISPARPSIRGRARERAEVNQRRAGLRRARPCSTPPASCNYNDPDIGAGGARGAGARTASRPRSSIPHCCGMPKLEQGDIARGRRQRARRSSAALAALDRQGLRYVALVPSCALMLKFEWPLILPERRRRRSGCRRRPSTSANTSSTSPRRRAWRRPEAARGGVSVHHRLPCPGAEHGPEGGRDAAPDARGRRHGDRALLRPWRHLGRAEGAISRRR